MVKKRVLLAMSGGVDSTAAAVLLRDQGYEIVGATMLLWRDRDGEAARAALAAKASALALRLGIEHHLIDLQDAFYERVVLPFIRSYQQGETPNPCLLCNRFFKFDLLEQEASRLLQEKGEKADFDFLATGHYARIIRDAASGEAQLFRALDPAKDQSYVLYSLSQERLSRLLLPLGDHSKEEAREIARLAGTPIPREDESQDICFVSGSYRQLLEAHGGFGRRGQFVDPAGHVLGPHRGIAVYTRGQRKKLGIALGERMSVLDIDPESGNITLGLESLTRVEEAYVRDLRFNTLEPLRLPLSLNAATRYQEKAGAAVLEKTVLSADKGIYRLRFLDARRTPSPGQAAVFYLGDRVIGGAVLTRRPDFSREDTV